MVVVLTRERAGFKRSRAAETPLKVGQTAARQGLADI